MTKAVVASIEGYDVLFSDDWSKTEARLIRTVASKYRLPASQVEQYAMNIVMLGSELTRQELDQEVVSATKDYSR